MESLWLVRQVGKADRDRRPPAHLTVDRQLPLELLDGLPHEDESQRVELAIQSLFVRLELLHLLRGHARPVVAHSQDDPVPFDRVANVDDAGLPVAHGIHGIHDEIEVHPPESGQVAPDDRRVQLVAAAPRHPPSTR